MDNGVFQEPLTADFLDSSAAAVEEGAALAAWEPVGGEMAAESPVELTSFITASTDVPPPSPVGAEGSSGSIEEGREIGDRRIEEHKRKRREGGP